VPRIARALLRRLPDDSHALHGSPSYKKLLLNQHHGAQLRSLGRVSPYDGYPISKSKPERFKPDPTRTNHPLGTLHGPRIWCSRHTNRPFGRIAWHIRFSQHCGGEKRSRVDSRLM